MNITLFGGSFNPPHLGHQLAISQAFEFIPSIQEIWLLIENQHSFNKDLAPSKHRLKMTRSLLNHKVKLQTCCLDQNMSGNTIEHLAYLEKTYPQHTFSFLLGSDNLASFYKWPQYKALLNKLTFYIYPRAGFPLKPLYRQMKPINHPLQIITSISSTMIRKRLQNNLPIKSLIPQKVYQYLKQNQPYLT